MAKAQKKSRFVYLSGRFGALFGRSLVYIGDFVVPFIVTATVLSFAIGIFFGGGISVPIITTGVGALLVSYPLISTAVVSAITIAAGLIVGKFNKEVVDSAISMYRKFVTNLFKPKTDITITALTEKLDNNAQSMRAVTNNFATIEKNMIAFIKEAKEQNKKSQRKALQTKADLLIQEIESSTIITQTHKKRLIQAVYDITANKAHVSDRTINNLNHDNKELQTAITNIQDLDLQTQNILKRLKSNESVTREVNNLHAQAKIVIQDIDKCMMLDPKMRADLKSTINKILQYSSQDAYLQAKVKKHEAKDATQRAASSFKRTFKNLAFKLLNFAHKPDPANTPINSASAKTHHKPAKNSAQNRYGGKPRS